MDAAPRCAMALVAFLLPLLTAANPADAQVRAAAVRADVQDDDGAALLQLVAAEHRGGRAAQAPQEHYWPHSRGQVGHYSQTAYGKMPEDLNKSLAWSWDAPNYNTILWSTLIDSQKNVYVVALDGIWKFSPEGKHVWFSPMSSESPSLVGDKLIGMRMFDCNAFALSLETGAVLWQKKIWPDNGPHGDFVEAHNGVAVVGVGLLGQLNSAGSPSSHAAGFSVENGDLLWTYEVQADCGLWNVMALFPDDESTIFSDACGGVYRLGLQNGTLLWHARGSVDSFSDGGSTLGPDGSTYTCSQPDNSYGAEAFEPGVLRKYRLSDGAKLWETFLPYPCVNFPSVSPDGRSVIAAPGGLALEAKTKLVKGMPQDQRKDFYLQQLDLGSKQRSFWNMSDLEASIMAFDTATGQLQWRHDVTPWGGVAFAGDEKRAWNWANHPIKYLVPHCWPSHWSSATIDEDGAVFIGRSSGDFYVYNPKTDVEKTFSFGDGVLMGGAAFAPGLMVFASCSSVYAFHLPEV